MGKLKGKRKKIDTFLGVVERNGSIFIPWRGTNVSLKHNFEPCQNLLVDLEFNKTGTGSVVKAELPTLEHLKQMKDELSLDWDRFTQIFNRASMLQKVLMLCALDKEMRSQSWEK